MSYECIAIDRIGKVGILTFKRERVLNAFDPQLIEETNAAMADFADDDEIGAVVVRGAGRAFLHPIGVSSGTGVVANKH